MDNLINLIFSAILVLIEENKEKDTKGETDDYGGFKCGLVQNSGAHIS